MSIFKRQINKKSNDYASLQYPKKDGSINGGILTTNSQGDSDISFTLGEIDKKSSFSNAGLNIAPSHLKIHYLDGTERELKAASIIIFYMPLTTNFVLRDENKQRIKEFRAYNDKIKEIEYI